MIAEWLTHKLTPALPEARKLGYLRELIAISARHQRCHAAWRDHLARTRRFVLWAVANCRRSGKVTVLGSGLLLDLPLTDLAAEFDEVVLVDIVHGWTPRDRADVLPNVRLVEADLTDMAETIAGGEVPAQPPVPKIPDGDADLVISLNLLGQLPLIPMRHVPEETADRFAAAVQRHHLRALQALPGQVCLITETRREWLADGTVDAWEDPLFGLTLPEPEESWTWRLAPAPELEPDRDLRLRVDAYSDFFRK